MDYLYIPGEHQSKEAPCRYQLAVFAAQRARQLVEGDKPTCETKMAKPTIVAIQEILKGDLKFFYGPEAVRYQEEAARARRALKNQSLFKERDEEIRREIKKDLSVYLAEATPKEIQDPSTHSE